MLKKIKSFAAAAVVCLSIFAANADARSANITISFDEQFFDALLESVFQHSAPPEFPLAFNARETPAFSGFGRGWAAPLFGYAPASDCRQTVKLLRETNGVRTAVRFRGGQILAPIAFSGGYNPPLVGCVPFAGYAETRIDLRFDAAGRRLYANATVMNVNLNGTGGVGGQFIARLVQSSIDKKINPIEIISLDKVTFDVPVQNAGGIRMQATGISSEVGDGVLNIRVSYDFVGT